MKTNVEREAVFAIKEPKGENDQVGIRLNFAEHSSES